MTRVPFVIAEQSGTHEGVLDRMLDGIAVAKACDADAWKTWWCSSAAKAAARVHAPELVESYRAGEFPPSWLAVLRDATTRAGLELLVTVDCPEDIEVVAPYVDRFKIASWGATDRDFFYAHAKHGKPIIISTGTCSMLEADNIGALDYEPPVWRLHCVSAYPAPLAECNLLAIRHRLLDGFSDHTANVVTGSLAVAAGARVLEVHFRHDETSPTHPDYPVSLSPSQLEEYVYWARLAAVAMGDGVKRVMPSERENVRYRYVV